MAEEVETITFPSENAWKEALDILRENQRDYSVHYEGNRRITIPREKKELFAHLLLVPKPEDAPAEIHPPHEETDAIE